MTKLRPSKPAVGVADRVVGASGVAPDEDPLGCLVATGVATGVGVVGPATGSDGAAATGIGVATGLGTSVSAASGGMLGVSVRVEVGGSGASAAVGP